MTAERRKDRTDDEQQLSLTAVPTSSARTVVASSVVASSVASVAAAALALALALAFALALALAFALAHRRSGMSSLAWLLRPHL